MYSTVVSDVGTVRSNNQDSAFAGEHLIAICDGMGGHAGGDTASTIAIRSLAHIEQDNVDGDVQVVSHMMATSVMAAHDAIVGKAKRERRLAGMGTTVTSVALVAGCWVLAHIGDSRAYLLHDGRARNVEEAILWHGGEAVGARNAYSSLSKAEREALIAFVNSL